MTAVGISKDMPDKTNLLTSFGLVFVQFKSRANFLVESELLKVLLEVNETKEMPQGRQLALSDMITEHETSV